VTKDFGKENVDYKAKSSKFKLFNYKIFIGIIGIAILNQVYISSYEDTPGIDFPEIVFIFAAVTCGIISIIVGIKYILHETFRTSYIALGIYFFLLAFGEIIYMLYSRVFLIDAYPSMADVFYLSAALFAFVHLIMNINYFKDKLSSKIKIILPTIGVSTILIHSLFSFNQIGEINLDFFMGLLYASENAILLPLAALGMIVARKTILGATWLLLVIGIFFLGIGQVWWIFLEFFEGFDYRHPVNTLWLFGYMVVTFALVEHLRIFSKKK